MKCAEKFLDYLKNAITPFHAVKGLEGMLKEEGFNELYESEVWNVNAGGKYYVKRNDSSIIAFKVPTDLSDLSFNMVASHTDSPTYKLKPVFNMPSGDMLLFDTEPYGGGIHSSWFDRPLSVAGRVTYINGNQVKSALYDLGRAIVIPNLAIHQNRDINSGHNYNPQVDLLPLVGSKNFDLYADIAGELGIEKEAIKGLELSLYNKDRGTLAGTDDEFIVAPQIDNLECAFASMKAFVKGENKKSVNVYCAFNNEEVGSGTMQGALSTFLKDTLKRIMNGFNLSKEEQKVAIAKSFMVSADNAHADHPNYKGANDQLNAAQMGKGVVIKTNANQSYCTDSVSKALFEEILDRAEIPHQTFANRSDVRGGSTLGHLSLEQVSVSTVDIGLAQLAMHSAMETANADDFCKMVKGLIAFYNTHLTKVKDEFILE